MSPELLTDLTIFLLSVLVGFEVISKVPATLHTPLMSAANAIHGVILVGAMVIAVSAETPLGYALALVAAVFAAMNVVGGYAVTDRMLQMFRRPAERADARTVEGEGASAAVPPVGTASPGEAGAPRSESGASGAGPAGDTAAERREDRS
ncbi:NAD(P) transhydrogenase subunit alpha [Lipingzhangella halophila]|uniref:proton-translocating NAD(P)(+) transhydrogenase n=1 Tax=Lipingzhangella halophila TaxID=1783352 RepID=A0A7W7RIH4_9ACTN|nr:NAD(P) transhydrogenase subunit alpha [Lipingzhangella halophila]MBB4932605.1 NAD(P) transhydrogenase subunit alpha [Lipingzhangella halophila]